MFTDSEFWTSLVKEALAHQAEYNFLDFKLTLSGKTERLKEHLNAFGNLEHGGCFVFGIKNFKIVGINNEWNEIITKLAHLAKDSQEPSLDIEPFKLTIDNKNLLCVHVLAARSKPAFIKDRAPMGGKACYKRSGSTTIPMSTAEIRNLLISDSETYYDESIVLDTKLDELDFTAIAKLLPDINIDTPYSEKNLAILVEHNILVARKSNPETTVAAWLCFAKEPQSHRPLRNSTIELQLFNGPARDIPIKKHIIVGNLPQQIATAVDLLQQYSWTIPKIQGIRRTDIPAYSTEALREVITNSVVHRDYTRMHQPVKINIFSNRVEIENPGCLMPGLTIYNLIHRRDWRNPLLAELMKRFGFGEMDGQGIDRLYATILEIKVPPPVFINHENSFTVILSAPKDYTEFTPEEKRLLVIITAIMHDKVDNETIRNCFEISSEQAGTLIKAMVADDILQASTKSRKYAKYQLTKMYRDQIFS